MHPAHVRRVMLLHLMASGLDMVSSRCGGHTYAEMMTFKALVLAACAKVS